MITKLIPRELYRISKGFKTDKMAEEHYQFYLEKTGKVKPLIGSVVLYLYTTEYKFCFLLNGLFVYDTFFCKKELFNCLDLIENQNEK